MRMKFNRSSQLVLVSVVSLLAAGLVTACGTLTVDFVFVTSAKAAGPNNYGEVNVFEVNSESGFMRQIKTSPFPSGGRNPVAEAASADGTTLYVINQDDNSIVQFTIGNDGKLYPQNTLEHARRLSAGGGRNRQLPLRGGYVPAAANMLHRRAVFRFRGRLSDPERRAGQRPEPPTARGHIGCARGQREHQRKLLAIEPGQLSNPCSDAHRGHHRGFGRLCLRNRLRCDDTLDGRLCVRIHGQLRWDAWRQWPGSPFPAGTHPSAIAPDPSGSYVYVTDFARADVLTYSIGSGPLTPVAGSPFPAGNAPSAIVVDATGKYAYVANSQDANVTAYSISNGVLTFLGGSSTPVAYATGSQPVAIGIDPSLNQYLYTANFLGNTVSGFEAECNGRHAAQFAELALPIQRQSNGGGRDSAWNSEEVNSRNRTPAATRFEEAADVTARPDAGNDRNTPCRAFTILTGQPNRFFFGLDTDGPPRRKRMKFSKLSGSPATGGRRWGSLSQLFLVSSIGLLVATLLTACQLVTIDYVFVSSAAATTACSGGEIETFASDSQSGALRTGAAPVCAGGVNPVAMAVTSDYTNLYVANHGDDTVVHFAVASNGVLTAKDTVTLSTAPTSVAVNCGRHFSVCRLRHHLGDAD